MAGQFIASRKQDSKGPHVSCLIHPGPQLHIHSGNLAAVVNVKSGELVNAARAL